MTNIYDNKLGKSKSQQRIRKKDTSEEAFKILRNMKKKYPEHLSKTCKYKLYPCSIRNMFVSVRELIKGTFDILIVSECTLDSCFLDDQC